MTKTFNLKDVRFCNGNITKTAEWYDTLSVSIQNKVLKKIVPPYA